jgi:GDPmannose 4,6-dehydratase
MKPLKCVVTGISGQLGSYMAELLISLGYEVVGTIYDPKASTKNYRHLFKNESFGLLYLDVNDQTEVESVIEKERPDYFFNFAGSAFVSDCWEDPISAFETNSLAIINILEAIKKHKPECRFFNACSSEIFAGSSESPQKETTAAKPISIYGVSKNSAREIVESYRQKYNLFAVSGIFYNMESNRREDRYVTKKITTGVARIKKALENREQFEPIKLGNLDAKKDFSFAVDGVEAAFLMTSADTSKDYVISSGESHLIKEFVELAFQASGIEGCWVGEKLNEYYVLPNYLADFAEFASQKLVTIDPEFIRTADSIALVGDSGLAKEELNWQPKTDFKSLVKKMVEWDIQELEKSS